MSVQVFIWCSEDCLEESPNVFILLIICPSAVSPSYLHQPQAGTTWECLEKMLKSKCLTFFITNYFNKKISTSIQCHKNTNRKLFNLLLKELQRTVYTKAMLCEVYCQVQWLSWDPGPRLETFNQWTCCLIDWCRCSGARRVTYEPSRSARRRIL